MQSINEWWQAVPGGCSSPQTLYPRGIYFRWTPETTDSPEPYIYCFFFLYTPTIKFNLCIWYIKRLTTIIDKKRKLQQYTVIKFMWLCSCTGSLSLSHIHTHTHSHTPNLITKMATKWLTVEGHAVRTRWTKGNSRPGWDRVGQHENSSHYSEWHEI